MTQAGSLKRDKNMFQNIFSRIAPIAEQGQHAVGNTILGKVATAFLPMGIGSFVNKGVGESAKGVGSTLRWMGGDIDSQQYKNEMYKNYFTETTEPIRNFNEIRNNGLIQGTQNIANREIDEEKDEFTSRHVDPYRNFFNLIGGK